MKAGMRAGAAAWMMVSVAILIQVYGLGDILFFNKAAASLGVFVFGWAAFPGICRQWQEGRRDFLIAYAMAWGLCFTEILGGAMRLEVARGGVDLSSRGAAAMVMTSLIFAFAAEPCFNRLLHTFIQPGKKCGRDMVKRIFFGTWIFLFLGYLPCLLAFYPGLYCYDMSWQWQQFIQWDFSTHHPLIHTMLGGGLFELGKILGGSYNKGIFLYCLVQTGVLTGAMAFAVRFLAKRGSHPAAVIGTGAFFLLFPFFPVMGISTTKDTLFAAFFLIVFVCVCEMTEKGEFYRGGWMALFLVCSVLMSLFRNNAVYGLAVIAVCLSVTWAVRKLRHKKSRFLLKIVGLLAICMAVSQGLFVVMEKGLDAKKGSRAEMLSLPMQQIARSYVYHQDQFSGEDREKLLTYFDEECVLRYKYYVSDPVKSGFHMEEFEMGDFLRFWLKLGKKFPGEYVKAPLYNMMGLWYLGGDSSCYMEYRMSQPVDEGHVVETRSKLQGLKEYYSWFTDENLQRYLPGVSLFFYTSCYSWCVALAAGICVARRKYSRLILPLFLAGYGVTLVFGPCITVRYMMCIMVCVPVLAVLVLEK